MKKPQSVANSATQGTFVVDAAMVKKLLDSREIRVCVLKNTFILV